MPPMIGAWPCRLRIRRSGFGMPRGSRRSDAREPFANFYFGGFGNNYVDHQDEKRYREYYALPGAELNEIGGRNFVKSGVEWNLPPRAFPARGHAGLLSDLDAAGSVCRAAWSRISMQPVSAAPWATSAANSISGCNMLSTLDLTLSVGGAVAYERGAAPRREAMVSLKILR